MNMYDFSLAGLPSTLEGFARKQCEGVKAGEDTEAWAGLPPTLDEYVLQECVGVCPDSEQEALVGLPPTLDDYVRQQGQLAWEEATRLLLQACRGVAEVHRQGAIHRDINALRHP